jgi:MFS transporter, DHA1 family, multidrug resistance protein
MYRLLYRRATRIRKLTGDSRFKSLGEIDGEDKNLGDLYKVALVRPFILGFVEPIVALLNLYIARVYGTVAFLARLPP